MSCLEPLEQSILHSPLVAQPSICVMEERSEWKPVINPVHNYTLEPLEQSLLSLSLVARPIEGITDKLSDWKPVINPVQDITPDGRPMEGTAYPEHSALGVSLDSGHRAGMSNIEPVRQSVFNTLSVARPEAGFTKETTDWEPVALPVPGTTLDGRLREGNTYLEPSALGVSLDSGLMEWMSRP